jgi:mannose-1-phosphate guanylyltransferase
LQAAGGRFYGFDARGAYWADIGTPDEYRRASYDVVRGVVRIPRTTPNGIDPSATIASGARIEGPVRLGAGVYVGEGVSIEGPCVVDDRVRIEPGARLQRSILWQGARIGARSQLTDSIVGNDYLVEPESVLANALVAEE